MTYKKIDLNNYVDTTGGPLEQITMRDVWFEFQQRKTNKVILVAERVGDGTYRGTVYIPKRYFGRRTK